MTREETLKEIEKLEEELKHVKGSECEVYSRVVGFFRPVKDWNNGKQAEWKERVTYEVANEKG